MSPSTKEKFSWPRQASSLSDWMSIAYTDQSRWRRMNSDRLLPMKPLAPRRRTFRDMGGLLAEDVTRLQARGSGVRPLALDQFHRPLAGPDAQGGCRDHLARAPGRGAAGRPGLPDHQPTAVQLRKG